MHDIFTITGIQYSYACIALIYLENANATNNSGEYLWRTYPMVFIRDQKDLFECNQIDYQNSQNSVATTAQYSSIP